MTRAPVPPASPVCLAAPLCWLGLAAMAAVPACAPKDPLDGVERAYATTCRPTGAPPPAPKLQLTRYLSGLQVQTPVQMLPQDPTPGGSRAVFVVSQGGQIYRADDVTKDGKGALFLDLSTRVTAGGEMGLLSMALDPGFGTNGRFYVDYTVRDSGQLVSRVSRFRAPPPFAVADPKSEQILLTVNQPYENHNGGQLAFGPDGSLYVGLGDGGSGGDPQGNGQRLDTLLGKILRLDVSGDGATYKIPADNPFYKGQALANGAGANGSHCQVAGKPGACGEIWALGLRNPWRFSFDPLNGTLWAGDVGQGEWEEIDVIERGKNYGWKCMEGTHVFVETQDCKDKAAARAFTPPVTEYGHGEGKSVSGGAVYRGRALPALQGTYLFGDYQTGVVWGLAPGQSGGFVRSTLIPSVGGFISAFGTDADGEVYVVEYSGGKLLRIEPATPDAMGPPGWPERLSETGCFADLPSRRLVAGALPYAVNAPLWSDGAAKERALVLPEGATLTYTADGTWGLPEGTVLIKTFLLGGRPVETRFLIYGDGGAGTGTSEPGAVRGATYRWDEGGGDAALLSAGLTERVGQQDWVYPSRAECVGCHTKAAGGILGLATAQLNRDGDVFGVGALNQVDALARVGYLEGAPPAPRPDEDPPPPPLPRFPQPDDEAADLGLRARAYLHANCAHCHRPGGLSNATIDLRASTALAETKACDARAQNGDLGVAGAKVIAPGAPERSTLLLRMSTLDPATRMPSIGTRAVDEAGVALVRAWIAGLSGCQ